MNDEKTTEIELPRTVANNIVRVNFTERRKAGRAPTTAPTQNSVPAYTLRPPRAPVSFTHPEFVTPWWIRLVALAAILVLSLFVL